MEDAKSEEQLPTKPEEQPVATIVFAMLAMVTQFR